MLDTDSIAAPIAIAISTRADRARLRGSRRQPPITTEFEMRILRENNRKVLHAGAVSSLVSSRFLEALFMTTTDLTLQRIIPRNPHAPLWVVGYGVHTDFDESTLARYASQKGRPDLADRFTEPVEDRNITLRERWAELAGEADRAPALQS